jgi:hypothetical protein
VSWAECCSELWHRWNVKSHQNDQPAPGTLRDIHVRAAPIHRTFKAWPISLGGAVNILRRRGDGTDVAGKQLGGAACSGTHHVASIRGRILGTVVDAQVMIVLRPVPCFLSRHGVWGGIEPWCADGCWKSSAQASVPPRRPRRIPPTSAVSPTGTRKMVPPRRLACAVPPSLPIPGRTTPVPLKHRRTAPERD